MRERRTFLGGTKRVQKLQELEEAERQWLKKLQSDQATVEPDSEVGQKPFQHLEVTFDSELDQEEPVQGQPDPQLHHSEALEAARLTNDDVAAETTEEDTSAQAPAKQAAPESDGVDGDLPALRFEPDELVNPISSGDTELADAVDPELNEASASSPAIRWVIDDDVDNYDSQPAEEPVKSAGTATIAPENQRRERDDSQAVPQGTLHSEERTKRTRRASRLLGSPRERDPRRGYALAGWTLLTLALLFTAVITVTGGPS